MGVLVCEQLWILYSKLKFEVLYLNQFTIFFEKNKIMGYRLRSTTFQPLGLAFESFSTSFYLLFLSYMLYNYRWSNFFKNVANLPWRINPNKYHRFEYFFLQMWSCKVQVPNFPQGPPTTSTRSTIKYNNLSHWYEKLTGQSIVASTMTACEY